MKRRSKLFKFVAALTIVGILSIVSACGKDKSDPRDEFVGTYDIEYNCVGISFHNNGDPYNHEYFFLVEKSEFSDDELKFSGVASGNATVTLSGNDFVGGLNGTFMSNRIVFNDLGYHASQDCDEDLPVTAYKR